MKKIAHLVFLALFFMSCEDDEELSDLIGTWKMIDSELNFYLTVNKTQDIFSGKYDGSMSASRYINNAKNKDYALTNFNSISDIDMTYINITNQSLVFSDQVTGDRAVYSIMDYASNSLNQFDQSGLMVYSYESGFTSNFIGNNYLNYQLSNDQNEVTVNLDTLFFEAYTNEGAIIDSSSYVIIDGNLKKKLSTANANENFSMNSFFESMDYMMIPSSIEMTFKEDGTGKEIITDEEGTMSSNFNWTSTDSTISIIYDEEDDDYYEENGGGLEFSYRIQDGDLSLKQLDSFCDESISRSECEQEINYMFDLGIQSGTFIDMWTQIEVDMSKKSIASRKLSRPKIHNNYYHDKKALGAFTKWSNKFFFNK